MSIKGVSPHKALRSGPGNMMRAHLRWPHITSINRSTRETVKPLHAWPNGIKGWGDTSTFNSSAIFSHTLVGWAQLPPSIYTREERGLTSSLIRYTPLSNLVQPTVFVLSPKHTWPEATRAPFWSSTVRIYFLSSVLPSQLGWAPLPTDASLSPRFLRP